MTLEEFLTDYVPNVLKPLKGGAWSAYGASGSIRFEWNSGLTSCPLTAEKKMSPMYFYAEGDRLGLDSHDIHVIVSASDGDRTQSEIRSHIRTGLGLA